MKKCSVLLLLFVIASSAIADDYRRVISSAHPGWITNYHQHANLGQGYLIRDDGSRVYFVGLVDDGELWWWREWPRTRFDAAETCQALDVATTAVGLAVGFAEGNPLGVAVLPLKLALNEYAETLPTAQCNELKTVLAAAGCGAAGANIATISAGEFRVISVVAGLAAGATATQYSFSDCEAWVDE